MIRKPIPRLRTACLLFAALAIRVSPARSQELEPRTYAQTPTGVNFIAVGYGFSTGNVLMDPALPIEGLDADLDLIFLRNTRSFASFGQSAKFKVLAPWSAGDWQGGLEGEESIQRRRDSGAGDVRLAFEVSFRGAPAVNREEFGEVENRRVAGATIKVSVPTGDYESDKLLNLGSNRWSLRPEATTTPFRSPINTPGEAKDETDRFSRGPVRLSVKERRNETT